MSSLPPTDAYDQFLRAKVTMADAQGFPCEPHEVNPLLKPHQVAIVCWAVQGGQRAIFAAFGLGKTLIQLEVVRITRAKAGGMGLITLPLGVVQEFEQDAELLRTGDAPNITAEQRAALAVWHAADPSRAIYPKFIRRIEECDDPDGIYLTNYETVRDGKLDPRAFTVASLDEAACLRGFGGTKTFREFMGLFAGDYKTLDARVRSAGVRYRFVATATPSPNEFVELLAYAAFLGIMDVSQAKTRFFKRNSEKADELTIHPHKEREFWLWCASWGLFVQKPSDLGYSDEGYEMPELDVRWHEIPSDHTAAGTNYAGQGLMFKEEAIGIIEAAREKRDSLETRITKLMEVVHATLGSSSEARLQQGVLPEEPRAHAGRAKGTRSAKGSGQTRRSAGLPAGVPRDECSVVEREAAGAQQGGLCGEPSEVPGATPEGEAAAIRPDPGAASGDPSSPGARVPNLPKAAGVSDGANDRPLPRDRSGSRGPVPPVQHGTGLTGGATGQPRTSDRVSEHGQAGGLPQMVIWCDLNDEQRAIERALDAAGITHSSLYGSQPVEERMRLLADWRDRRTTVFLSKTSMYGAGVNLQQASLMVFAGIHFKFAEIIQGVHRIYRFLQARECHVHFIYTEAERQVRRELERRWAQHKELMQRMSEIIKEFGLSQAAMAQTLTRAMGVAERIEVKGERFTLVNEDCIREVARMPADSVGLILTSIPFSTQYEYSPNYADLGHTDNNAHFWEQMDFLIPELMRVLHPGRLAAVHVKDRIVPKGMTGFGFQTVYPFHADAIARFQRHGWGYMGMKTIVTDVVRENNQTYRLGWSEQCKDGSKMGFGMPEYLLLFRKPASDNTVGYADTPVVKLKPLCLDDVGNAVPFDRNLPIKPGTGYSRARWQLDAHGFTRSSGNRLLTPDELRTLPHDVIFKWFREFSLSQVYDFETHVRIGETLEAAGRLPSDFMLLQPQSWRDDVWSDITRMRTLNGAQSAAGREMHLCPMQFDIADRAIAQWTNPGEVVLDPFGGLMTVPYRAVMAGRKGYGIELSPRYFADGIGYCQAAEREMAMPSLFDTLTTEDTSA